MFIDDFTAILFFKLTICKYILVNYYFILVFAGAYFILTDAVFIFQWKARFEKRCFIMFRLILKALIYVNVTFLVDVFEVADCWNKSCFRSMPKLKNHL